MGTLASELGQHLDHVPSAPRVYADANIPAGVVGFMRQRLGWDVLFVMEHDDLRRARDVAHFRLARDMKRTLVTLDRDYCDDRQFPPEESGGVIVLSGPDERALQRILGRIDRAWLRPQGDASLSPGALPLAGRKLIANLDQP